MPRIALMLMLIAALILSGLPSASVGQDEESLATYSFVEEYFVDMPPLHWSAMRGQTFEIDATILNPIFDCPINRTDHYGLTALTWAVAYSQTRFVRELLERGAAIDAASVQVLPIAVQVGNPEIVAMLISAGADVERDFDKPRPAWEALEVLSYYNIDLTRLSGTPLCIAAQRGYAGIIQLLLDAGADVDLPGALGWTPLQLAVLYGNYDAMCRLVEAGADVNAGDALQMTPLHWAAEYGDVAFIQYLTDHGAQLEARDYSGATPLLKAAYRGHVDAVRLLLEQGADAAAEDNMHGTALYWSLHSGSGRGSPQPAGCDSVVGILREHGQQDQTDQPDGE